jgi:hypothetical protein
VEHDPPYSTLECSQIPTRFSFASLSSPRSFSSYSFDFSPLGKFALSLSKPVLSLSKGMNESSVETVEDFPFVLSLSKHVHAFFSTLLGQVLVAKNTGDHNSLIDQTSSTTVEELIRRGEPATASTRARWSARIAPGWRKAPRATTVMSDSPQPRRQPLSPTASSGP